MKPGFRIELVAAEPLVMDPIAMAFDENGRLFVVEMRDYSERRDERLGRIRLLEDTDSDGRFDKSSIYAADLPWPTAVICWAGGIFVGSSPDILYFKDTNGDGAADTREMVFTGFGNKMERLNVQQLLNSFTGGLDNRIHGATGGNAGAITSPKRPNDKPLELRGRDFSFDPRTFEIRAETGGAQHGLSFDDYGRKFVCSNSAHIQMLMYEEIYANRNPHYPMPRALVDIAEDGPAAPVYRISPDEPWRVIRTKWRVSGKVPGPIEGGGRASGYFTAATGVTIYRGNAFPPEYRGDAFIADCGSNLIHRKKLHPDGVGFVARRPSDERQVEFIASTDNWFRPVQFANAPDGTLYVADMYRETIEHPWSLPEPLKSHLDLNSGNDRGRIYRIVPEGFKQPKSQRLGAAPTAELVKVLAHENGWHRDTAARLLYERQDRAAGRSVERMLTRSRSPLGRMHALYALAGIPALKEKHLISAMRDSDTRVREHGARRTAHFSRTEAGLSNDAWQELRRLSSDRDPRVRYETAFALGNLKGPQQTTLLAGLATTDDWRGWIRAAVFSGLAEGAGDFARHIHSAASGADAQSYALVWPDLVRLIARQKREPDITMILDHLESNQSLPQHRFTLAKLLSDGLIQSSVESGELASAKRRLEALAREAARVAANSTVAVSDRVAATSLLSTLPWPQARETLLPLIHSSEVPTLQMTAISTAARFSEREASEMLVQRWAQLTPKLRAEFLNATFARAERVLFLLDAVAVNQIDHADLSSTQAEQLRAHRDPVIRERAAKLFPPARTSREEAIAAFQTSLDLAGNLSRGRKIFSERCASCHKVNGEGHAVGPDLASAKSSGKVKLLAGIIDPAREVPPNFVNYIIETKSGESFSGIIAAESDSNMTLRRAFGEESVVPRGQIERIQSSGLSLMPEGLEAGLSAQDMADLMEFIVAGDR